MDIESLKLAGICFDYCPTLVMPQIPRVQDVLYAINLGEDSQINYEFCVEHFAPYIANVHLVIAAVAGQVTGQKDKVDEEAVIRAIAYAIIELCPAEARCLLNEAYVGAMEVLGEPLPPRPFRRNHLSSVCICPICEKMRESRGKIK